MTAIHLGIYILKESLGKFLHFYFLLTAARYGYVEIFNILKDFTDLKFCSLKVC